MREVFSRTVKDDRITVSEGTFQSTGVEDGWADLVVIAQVCGGRFLASGKIQTGFLGLSLVP